MASQNIAVIGGGPKAAALAAEAYCLPRERVDLHAHQMQLIAGFIDLTSMADRRRSPAQIERP